ncbi:hypothetical protein BY996DRAFT_8316497 [Phakopsora pachyrhizi]|uniref:Expressed protein n=1 Tax=Phakopsora pachyrhizi TaxID=170000 RepID=A0AAV0BE02_PHAPC|nr:hypothetical protein BY996DRAFT_8316497 [Phakopsora pachyrhizi]CAH7682625.1 expressed protein [Phakopsora pachyrhizi]CAH7684108.1 expressed protein [Phakopsora pachyrhizi]
MLGHIKFHFIIFSILLILNSLPESIANSTSGSVFLRRGGKKSVLHRNLQVKRSDLAGSDNDNDDTVGTPSSTEARSYARVSENHKDPVKISRRSQPVKRGYQQGFLRGKVHIYLSDLHEGIQARHRNIKDACAKKVTRDNAQRVGWKILAELEAILALCLACASRIKGCASSPTPSGIPTPGGYTNTGNPSLGDICQLVYRLLCEFKECFKTVGALCSQNVIIKKICSDTLSRISEALSVCLIATGGKVDGAIRGVNNSYGGYLNGQFFDPIGFGFNSLGSIFNSQLFYK